MSCTLMPINFPEPRMQVFKADLHSHTRFSDGILGVEELLTLAHEHKLNALSITDHDTLEAYPHALDFAQSLGLQLLPGIELSTHYEHTCVHVLGYGFDLNHEGLNQTLVELAKARQQRIKDIFERLIRRGLNVDLETFKAHYQESQLGRAHIAHYLAQLGIVKSIEEAFDHYLGDNQVGSLMLKTLTTEEGIDLIHQAGGVAVLAHPYHIKYKNRLRKILKLPFDGIEVFYANYPRSKTATFEEFAVSHQKFMTGGSDFHRPQPFQPLGCSYTPEATFNHLIALHRQNN